MVIAQDSGRLYLVNEGGVIAAGPETQGSPGSHVQHDYSYTTACVNETMHVTDTSHKTVELLRSALRDARLENERLQSLLESKCNELESIRVEQGELESEVDELQATLSAISLAEIERLKLEVQSQTAKAKRFWRMRCEQMLESDELIEAKELEIAYLQAQLAVIRTRGEKGASSNVTSTEFTNIVASTPKSRQRETNSCLASPKLMENGALSNS